MDDQWRVLDEETSERLCEAVAALGISIQDVAVSISHWQEFPSHFFEEFGQEILDNVETHKRKQNKPKRGERGTDKRRQVPLGFVQRAYRHQSR